MDQGSVFSGHPVIDTYSFREVKEIIHKHIEEEGSKDGSLKYPFYNRQPRRKLVAHFNFLWSSRDK